MAQQNTTMQNPMIQRQVAAGLNVMEGKKTGNYYKHLYVHSADRLNKASTLSTDINVFMSNAITIPDDGTTYLLVHYAGIPYTFANLRKPIKFDVTQTSPTAITRTVTIPAGFYDSTDLLNLINAALTAAPSTGWVASVSAIQKLQITFGTGAIGNITFDSISPYDLAFSISAFGFTSMTKNSTLNVITGDNVFAPFQTTELFLRVGGIGLSYDLIDSRISAPSDVIAVIPMNADTFGQLITIQKEHSLHYALPPGSRVNRLYVQLTYRDGTLVDLQGMEWSVVFSLIKEN
jgi:hypothetical protein